MRSDKATETDVQFQLTQGQKIGFYSLSLIACLLIVYAFWQLIQTVNKPSVVPAVSLSALSGKASQTGQGTASAQGRLSIEILTDFDPFYPKENGVNTPLKKAPESTLKLTLYGLRSGGSNDQGSVILKVQGDRQKLVKTGDMITDGVRLLAVYDNHIEISRNGRREAITYRLNRKGATVSATGSKPVGQPVSSVQSKNIAADQIELMKSLDMTAFREGRRIKGFQVGSKAEQTLVSLLQLQKDDIILAVNGESLTSFERAQELPEKLMPNVSALDLVSKNISITLERRGEEMTISVPLMVLVSHFGLQKISQNISRDNNGDQAVPYKVKKG